MIKGSGRQAARLIGARDEEKPTRRMIVTSVEASGLIKVRPIDDSTAGDKTLALIQTADISVDDEVVVGPCGSGEAVYGRLRRTSTYANLTMKDLTGEGLVILGGGSPSASLGSAAGGTGSSISLAGNDTGFRIVLVTGNTPTTGTLLTITFAAAKSSDDYGVWLSPADSDAGVAGARVYAPFGDRSTTQFLIQTDVALPANRSHYWYCAVLGGPS